jgi:hypothetical protein
MISIIDQSRMENAMQFLAESDLPYAQEKMELEQSAILQKRTRARAFLSGDGSVENRKAAAEVNLEVQAADDRYCECVKAFEELRARRQRAELVIDIFRTLEASRRKA